MWSVFLCGAIVGGLLGLFAAVGIISLCRLGRIADKDSLACGDNELRGDEVA